MYFVIATRAMMTRWGQKPQCAACVRTTGKPAGEHNQAVITDKGNQTLTLL